MIPRQLAWLVHGDIIRGLEQTFSTVDVPGGRVQLGCTCNVLDFDNTTTIAIARNSKQV